MKKSESCPVSCSSACTIVNWLICLLFFLMSVAALVGVYRVIFTGTGLSFGSATGSLAIIAFVVSLALWSKWMCRCMCCCGK